MTINYDVEILSKLRDASTWFIIITIISAIGIFYFPASILAIISLILTLSKGLPLLGMVFNMAKSIGRISERGSQGTTIFIPIGYLLQTILGVLTIISGFIISRTVVTIEGLIAVGSIVLTLIGYLFIGLALYEMGKPYENVLIMYGGIIVIITRY